MILNQGVRILNEVLNMNSSPDDRYIYCVTEKSIKVYDSKEKEIIQELKKLGNAKTAISKDGHFLGCVRPMNGCVQVTIYDIKEKNKEVLKKIIHGEDSTIFPCFSYDGRYMIVCNGEVQDKVWSIDTLNGKNECIYQCDEKTIVTNIDSNEFGILLSVCNGSSLVPQSCHVYFENVKSKPKVIQFNIQNIKDEFYYQCGERLFFVTHWLEKSKALIMYEARGWAEAFQIVDFEENDKITPKIFYEIPYSMNSGIRLSKNKKYAACIASVFNEEKRKVEQRVYVFDTYTGEKIFSRIMNVVWDVNFLNEKEELLISGDVAEIVSFTSE